MHNSVDPTHADDEREPYAPQRKRTAAEWAVESFDVGLWELDVATFALELSPRAGQLLGVTPGHSTCDALIAAMHPSDRAMIPAAIERAIDPAGNGHFQVDFRVVDMNGRITWLDSRAHTEFEYGSTERRAVWLHGAMLDITERKQTEERSRQSEAHLRVATEAALFYSWEIDLETFTYQSSHNARDVIGFDLPSTIADVWAIIHEDDRPAFDTALSTAIENVTSFIVEFRFVHPVTGTNAWVCSSGVALPATHDKPPRVVGVTQNINERKQAELTLRQSEERYRTLFASITEGFTLIEKVATPPGARSEYVFVEANARLEHHAGLGSFAGKTIRDAFPLVSQRWSDAFDQIIASGTSLRLQDGYRFKRWMLEINAFRIEDQTNSRIGVLIVDITDRHNAERMRASALAATEQARQTAVAAITTRDQFISIASHELRTPLTSLLGYAQMLESGMVQQPDMVPQLAQLIARQAHRLNALVGQMLDTSRLERGQFAIDPTLLDLDELVRQVVDEFRLTLSATARHRLQLHAANRPLHVMADADRMVQVFQNLLTNAVKYSPFGSPLDVRVRSTTAEAIIEVIDQGIGITPDAQSHIFEAFYRADNAGSIASGFGLGLHVAQEIVTRHGGRIEIESVVGEGSTFRVVVPRLVQNNGW